MQPKNTSVSRIENEKQLLRFLCASGEAVPSRREVLQRLAKYSWRENEHQILFEAIGELLAAAPQQILEHLPAALTRRGFPDTSCESLATPSAVNAGAALKMAEDLLRASHTE
jgi:hypothetical protein